MRVTFCKLTLSKWLEGGDSMKVKTKQFSLVLAAVLALLISNVYAQPQGEGFPGPKSQRGSKDMFPKAKLYEKLNLSPEQQEQLEAYHNQHREESKKLHKSIKEKREALREDLERKDLDMSKVKKLHAQVKAAQGRIEDYRLEGILKVREILTPEQFVEFKKVTDCQRKGAGKSRPKKPKRGR